MDELWDEKARHFAVSQESFGVSLLRQARQRVSDLPPTTEGQHHAPSISDAANEAFERLEAVRRITHPPATRECSNSTASRTLCGPQNATNAAKPDARLALLSKRR